MERDSVEEKTRRACARAWLGLGLGLGLGLRTHAWLRLVTAGTHIYLGDSGETCACDACYVLQTGCKGLQAAAGAPARKARSAARGWLGWLRSRRSQSRRGVGSR